MCHRTASSVFPEHHMFDIELTTQISDLVFPGVVHQCPPTGSGIMPCCGRTPLQVSPFDRMTVIAALVTCDGECSN